MKYLSVSTVDATLTTLGEAKKKGLVKKSVKGKVSDEGYLIKTNTGYQFAPKDQFDAMFTPLDSNPINQSVEFIVSKDPQLRLIGEFTECNTRTVSLRNFLRDYDKRDPKPKTPKEVFEAQLSIMEHYLEILSVRCRLEGLIKPENEDSKNTVENKPIKKNSSKKNNSKKN